MSYRNVDNTISPEYDVIYKCWYNTIRPENVPDSDTNDDLTLPAVSLYFIEVMIQDCLSSELVFWSTDKDHCH